MDKKQKTMISALDGVAGEFGLAGTAELSTPHHKYRVTLPDGRKCTVPFSSSPKNLEHGAKCAARLLRRKLGELTGDSENE